MLLIEKAENAIRIFHNRMTGREKNVDTGEGVAPEGDIEKSFKENLGLDTEKGDILAMIISAALILIPAVLLVLLILVGIPYLLFFH